MNQIMKGFENLGIIPVVVLDHSQDALPLAGALISGGLPCAEVTFRTDAAEESIRLMSEAYPQLLVGAGTILSTDQAKRAVDAGAKFIVSPGLNPEVVRYCQDLDIPIIPGCSNPTDIEAAIALGLKNVKFFPAEASGGLPMIQALAAPYHQIRFMPTGGINEKNVNTYLAFPKIIACGGSWMVAKDLIQEKNWTEITNRTRQAVNTMLGLNLRHIGINPSAAHSAQRTASLFASLFGIAENPGNSSIFVNQAVEVMKEPGRGAKGHIAIGTNSVERAMFHLAERGFSFDDTSAVYQENGSLKAIYICEDFDGFALHLLKNS